MTEFAAQRRQMIDQQLRGRGIMDPKVLAAMGRVHRHLFLDPNDWHNAYGDFPLPIGHGQTISQPYMVARMVELCELKPNEQVLEVGGGSGYQAAVLAQIAKHVFATEIVEPLANRAAEKMQELGIHNVTVENRDGSLGWAEHAPFDAIVVAAAAPDIPQPLTDQLAEGGRLVIPVGSRAFQTLKQYTKHKDGLSLVLDTACRFVNLQGEYGWR
ncbi:MAG: protein-L-isoaspartate(D-aspartate) O-methyltransferase [Pseudomonadota bacterium]